MSHKAGSVKFACRLLLLLPQPLRRLLTRLEAQSSSQQLVPCWHLHRLPCLLLYQCPLQRLCRNQLCLLSVLACKFSSPVVTHLCMALQPRPCSCSFMPIDTAQLLRKQLCLLHVDLHTPRQLMFSTANVCSVFCSATLRLLKCHCSPFSCKSCMSTCKSCMSTCMRKVFCMHTRCAQTYQYVKLLKLRADATSKLPASTMQSSQT